MEAPDKQDREMKHEEITGGIIGCAFDVLNELGSGFLESVYERALLLALRQKGFAALPQHPIRVLFRGEGVEISMRIFWLRER